MVHLNGDQHYQHVIKILTDADKPKKKKTETQLFFKKKVCNCPKNKKAKCGLPRK